jgi:glycosyltransferase involved in cell wall biosynthesis
MAKLKVAVIAPPWLALPIKGYGGIELVLEGLIRGLKDQGVTVEVFANGARVMKGVKTHSLYKEEQFSEIHKPYYESASIVQAHLQFSLDRIRKDGSFDIIHDHNTLIGPQFLAMATQLPGMPPALHTFHGPPFSNEDTLSKGVPNNRLQLEQLHDMGRMYMVAISEAMSKMAPKQIKPHLLPAVHNAIQLNDFPFVAHKKDYFITLARFSPDKGQHIAVKLAVKLNKSLRMAGTIAGIGSNRRLLLELSNPLSSYRSNQEFRYYSDKILPAVLHHRKISYVGNLSGARKMTFISQAKALLFPIDWEEPFGMAVIEALACGTPVVAMNRGAMPEIIEHGVTGFLANNEKEFEEYMLRVDEIDPTACRRSIEEKFSSGTMALNYIDRYNEVIKLANSKIKR